MCTHESSQFTRVLAATTPAYVRTSTDGAHIEMAVENPTIEISIVVPNMLDVKLQESMLWLVHKTDERDKTSARQTRDKTSGKTDEDVGVWENSTC